jgi:AcrR family transcriptional regulator
MARPLIGDADERILEATIQVAGRSKAGFFSTQEIAEVAGLSEFTVYNRFKNKQTLIERANERATNIFLEAYRSLQNKNPTSEAFFNAYLTALLAHPDCVYFAMNYCLVFPRANQGEEYRDFEKILQDFLAENRSFFRPDLNDAQWFTLFCYAVRQLLGSAFLILNGVWADNKANRHMMYLFTYKGLASLPRKIGAPELH